MLICGRIILSPTSALVPGSSLSPIEGCDAFQIYRAEMHIFGGFQRDSYVLHLSPIFIVRKGCGLYTALRIPIQFSRYPLWRNKSYTVAALSNMSRGRDRAWTSLCTRHRDELGRVPLPAPYIYRRRVLYTHVSYWQLLNMFLFDTTTENHRRNFLQSNTPLVQSAVTKWRRKVGVEQNV